MSDVREWLRSRIQGSNEAEERNFTDVYDAVVESPFYRLPVELRQQILRFAFSDRTIHLDLIPSVCFGSLRFEREICYSDSHSTLGPQQLKWWSCVCHRPPGQKVWDDTCRQDYFSSVPGIYNVSPDRLGVTGWLLSCRLGYIEVERILYSENTFHISMTELTQNLDVALPLRYLEAIHYLELQCTVRFCETADGETEVGSNQPPGWLALGATLSHIADCIPALHRLCLSIIQYGGLDGYGVAQPHEANSKAMGRFLDHVGKILYGKIEGTMIEVAIPCCFFDYLSNVAPAPDGRVWKEASDGRTGFWISEGTQYIQYRPHFR